MRQSNLSRRFFTLALAAVMAVSCAAPAFARQYSDYDSVTSHINLQVPHTLELSRPTQDITTSADAYFITGSSDPNQSLTMNGETVENRGSQGSFGVYVSLQDGANTFTFQQGGTQKTVTITKGSGSGTVTTTTVISQMAPSYDAAKVSGDTIKLSCVAPSGASVTAVVGGRRVQLKQQAATAVAGVPATFTGQTTAGQVNGLQDLGQVTYILNGSKEFTSSGKVYIAGSMDDLQVQVKNYATNLYDTSNRAMFIETLKAGTTDFITDMTDDMYQLATGGWIYKESVEPLPGSDESTLRVTDVIYGPTGDGRGDVYSLAGKGRPTFRAYQDSEKLYVKLFNTYMSNSQIQQLKDYVSQSSLFTQVEVTEEDLDVIFRFQLAEPLWGYDITYGQEGGVNIFARPRPALSTGGQPLSNIIIAVDAGHGGTDPGAIGIPGTEGAMEKDITLATAQALQKRLQNLGATVIFCREGDSSVSMNDRMALTNDQDADLFISLHCNSIGYTQDANKPSGTEVYYFENIAKDFASMLSANVASATGRTNRGAKLSNYRVTLNTYAPAVLVEMGFLTNPAEYDQMTSKQGIYQTVNGISDSILDFLS